MKHKTNTMLILIAAVAIALTFIACNKSNDDGGNDYDDLYMATSYNILQNYYKPKKADLFAWKGNVIVGDWYYNEKKRLTYIYSDIYGGHLDYHEAADNAQEYAEHYFFLNEEGFKKYCEASENSNQKIMIDEKDIISPYKEYAAYYGDTTHLKHHDGALTGSSIYNACVLPLLSIDVVTNKDFDADHPAGSKLNDILYYDQSHDTYEYLKNKEYKGEALYWGRGSCKDFEPRRLDLIPENPVYLMESEFWITFDHAPATPGTYEFTIKFTFGPDPLSGETVDIEPVTVSMEF